MHSEVEIRIVVVHSGYVVSDADSHIEFLCQFASQSLLRTFARFYLATWKFPPSLPNSIATLRSQQPPLLHESRCYHLHTLDSALAIPHLRIIYLPSPYQHPIKPL